jgi:methylamine utilization protein MauE
MIDPAVATLIAGSLALLFASAALHKIRDLAVFGEVLRAYRVLPPVLALPWALPLLEGLIAGALLIPEARRAAALGGALLLVLYALAMALNLRRGRRDLSCGCGAFAERRPIAAWMVARNLLLAALLAALTLPAGTRALEPVDLLTVAAGVALVTLLYLSADRLLGRIVPRAALWESPR